MNPINKFISQSTAVGTAALLLVTTLAADAGIVSVNFIQNPGNNSQQIDVGETFGITSQGTVVGGWMNVNAAVNNLTDSAGAATTVNISSTLQPNGQATFNNAFTNTPLFAGFDDYTTTPTPCGFTLSNLNANFPNGYKVIVYVGGFLTCTNASISDGTTTYYFRPATTGTQASNIVAAGFTQTTQTSNLGTNNPFAQYAVFGSPVLLTDDVRTFTIDTLAGGGSALCGFQIVGVTSGELAARIWKGNVNSDWNTSTFNWTNIIYGATNYADGDLVTFSDEAVAVNPTINLTATRSPGSVAVDSTKNYTFTGSGIAGATGLTKKGSGSLTLSNPNAYTGNTTISVGMLKIGASGSIPDGAGAGDVSVASGATLDLNGNSEGINGLSGSGTVDNTGAAATLSIGLDNDAGTFPGTLQGALALTKQGTNTVTLTGTASHAGATTVGQGTLVLNPLSSFSTSSALVVSNGALLELSFTNGSGLFTSSQISFNGGSALTVDYGNASVTAFGTPVTTSGALNLNGVTQIGIKGLNFGTGTFTIITYGSKTGAGSISSTPAFLPNGMVATIQDTGSAINLVVTTPSVQSLLWTQGDGEWSTNGFMNWNLGTATYTEYTSGFGDGVSFDNSNFGTVTLPHDVHPFSVTVAGNYVLTGAGRITGATGITRSGFTNTTFILDNTNTYTGVTTVSAGTLQVNRPGALGSVVAGTVVASGGSLALSNGITLSGEPLTLNGNGTAGGNNNGALRTVDTNSPITVSSPITLGSNARIRVADGGELILTAPITDNGSNYTVTLHAEQTNTLLRVNSPSNTVGAVTLYGNNPTRGRIRFDVVNAFASSLVNVGGGLFDLNGNGQSFAGLGNGFNPSLGVITNSSVTPAVLTANYSSTNTAQLLSAISGNISFVKTGTGVQSFGGGTAVKHSYSGTTTINDGVLGIASDLSGVTNSFIVNNGGALRGSGNVIGGPVTVNAGGAFYAGFATNAIGDLTISNNLSLAGELIVAINKDVSPSNDVINVSGALSYGGTMTVHNIGTNALLVGDTFTIFPPVGGGRSGSFSIVSEPGVTFGFNAASGVLTVLSVGPGTPSPAQLTNSIVGGTNLVLSWPAAQGWRLEYQANALNKGLGTNWLPATDVSVSSTNILIDRTKPTVFYRLAYP